MSPGLRAALLASLLLASGCASLVNGSRQEIAVEVEPAGATVLVLPDRTRHTAPTVLDLDRKRAYTLLVEHPGYEPERVYLDRGASPWVLGDFAFIIYPAALWVDTQAGGAYQLEPSQVQVRLRKRADE
jgi:hypothetical protein